MFSKILVVFNIFIFCYSSLAQEATGLASPTQTSFGEVKEEVKEAATPEVKNLAPAVLDQSSNASTGQKEIVATIDPRLELISKSETLFFDLDINLLSDTQKEDLGVSDLKNITESVVDAWKSWAKKDFSDFKNFENYKGEIDFKSALQHPKNVLILFKANIRRLKRVGVQEKIDIEISAEYIVVQLSNKKILGSFDYPYVHRSFENTDNKNLSSQVASLFYNLLVAKSSDVSSQIKSMFLLPSEAKDYEFSVLKGKNLIELNRLSVQLGNWAQKNKTLCAFTNKITSFSLNEAKIVLNSSCNEVNLIEVLKSIGKLELIGERSFHFLPDQKSFEIFDVPTENVIKKENLTP